MRIFLRLLMVVSASLLAADGLSSEEGRAELSVFSDGEFLISLPETPPSDPMFRTALDDFRRSLKLITGVAVPEGEKALKPLIFRIRSTRPEEASPTDAQAWGNFEIEVSEKEIVVQAVSMLGAANALYRLLDGWGCRWIMPGEIGECIPRASSLSLPYGRIDGTLSADFRVSGSAGNPATSLWLRRNQGHLYQRWLSAQHYWNYMLPPERYFDPQKPESYRPEYYALMGGKRTPTQLCTTNPEVVELAIQSAKEFFRQHPGADSFPADPNDNLDFCQCENCLKLDPPGLTPEGLPLMTDRVVDFANKIARGIRDEFPGKKVGFYAYMNHALPPVHVKPEPELYVSVTRSNYDLLHLTPRKEGDSAAQFYQLIKDWKAVLPSVYTYEYNPIYWNGNLLCPNYLDWAQTIKDTLAIGSQGIYSDGQIGIDNTVNFLNFYLMVRIAVDASRDPQTELSELCSAFYGPSSREMFEYFLAMSKVTEYQGGKVFGGGLRYYHEIFSREMMQTARRLLNEAKTKSAGQEPFATRVELADLGQQFLERYLDGVWLAQDGDFEASKAAFDRMAQVIFQLGEAGMIAENNVFNVKDTVERMRAAGLMAHINHFPEKMGVVRKWKLLGPLNNSDRGAELRADSFEPVKDIDQAIRLDNGETKEWIRYQNPGGFLSLKEAFPKPPASWNALYGYAGFKIHTPSKRSADFRMAGFNAFRVFLNGKEVFYRQGWDADPPDRNVARVILEKGDNTVVVKATHTSDTDAFPWGLWFRVTDRKGEPFPDVELKD